MTQPDTDPQERIAAFLSGAPFAVVGASTDPRKYGHKVLRCYIQNGLEVFPVHPSAQEIAGRRAYPRLADLPERPHGVSIVTPPGVTAAVVEQGLALGIRNYWMQPGAEHDGAIERASAAGANVIARGPCILVVLGYREPQA